MIGSRQGAVSKERMQLGHLQRGCQRHQTKVASHTETPLGVSKWLGKRHHTPRTLLLGKGHTQHMSPTQGQADIIGATPYQPFRSPYRGSCMAGYHCLMPTAFLPLQYNINLTSNGISFRCNTTHIYHLAAFPYIAKQHKSIGLRHSFPCESAPHG